MPTSRVTSIPKVIDAAFSAAPMSVLDIGAGMGKYGLLLREYLELWDGRLSLEYLRRIDGIEAHEAYVTPLVRLVYDNVYVGDALDVLPTLGHYDLILLADVLEHFTVDDGNRMLALMAEHGSHIIITTPLDPAPQEATFGNEYERHRSVWTSSDIGAVMPDTYVVGVEDGILITMSRGHE